MNDTANAQLDQLLHKFDAELPHFADGRINYSNSPTAVVLSCAVMYEDKLLILKRSDKVRKHQLQWDVVGGYLDEFKDLATKATIELTEELQLDPQLLGHVYITNHIESDSEDIHWITFPVLAKLNNQFTPVLDWEHTEYQWINLDQLQDFDLVKGVVEVMQSLKKFI